MSRAAPLWLAAPSRFAQLRRPRARAVLALFAALVLLTLTALFVPDPPALTAFSAAGEGQTDLALYEKIVAGVRGGGNYYTVAADALRAGQYPLRPFVTFRMPALAVVLAALPPWGAPLLLLALALTTALAWGLRIGEAFPRMIPRIVGLFLLAGSMLAFLQPDLVAFHEIWAGLLIALSLALRRPGKWIAPAGFALAAMLIRETAALYAIVMLAFAWRERARGEMLGWGAALLVFAAALAVHAYAVGGVTGPTDPASAGWAGLQGFGLYVKAVTLATGLQLLPLALAALLVGLALFGWAAWDDPLGLRVLATLGAYGLAISLFARPDNFYWGLMVAPVFLVGLAFVPDGLRDLVRQSLDRRRVTVTRVTR